MLKPFLHGGDKIRQLSACLLRKHSYFIIANHSINYHDNQYLKGSVMGYWTIRMKTWENPTKSEGKEETVMPNCKHKI